MQQRFRRDGCQSHTEGWEKAPGRNGRCGRVMQGGDKRHHRARPSPMNAVHSKSLKHSQSRQGTDALRKYYSENFLAYIGGEE